MCELDIAFAGSPIDLRCPIGGGVFTKGKAASFGLVSQLSNDEQSAASHYKDGGYHEMNGTLRGTWKATPSPGIQKDIADFSTGVNRGITKEAGVVYRGVAQNKISHEFFSASVGKKVTLPGFVSTSKSEEFAKGWSSGAFFRIYVPKHARVLEYKQIYGGHDHEHEVILPHNSKFTVHAVSKQANGNSVIDLIMHR